MYERMGILGRNDIQKIHDASMEILGDVGIAFHEPEAVDIFKENGMKAEGKIVFIDEALIEKALETAPSQFKIHARNPEKSVAIGGDNLVLCPGYGSPFIVDENGEQRDALMEDYDNFCKLVETSNHLDMNGCLMVEPADRSAESAHLDMLYSNIILCDKPFLGSSVSRQAAVDSFEMAGIAWDGKQAIKDKPVMMGIISSLSPLQYSAEMAGALIEYARNGQANMIALLMQAGATGPAALPGLLAVQNAEILAGVTLTQLVKPGAPVVYGTTSTITEMRTGALSIGAPELAMIQNATLQMARFYNLPSRGSGGLTDAHFPDMQAGMESALALAITIMSGANFVLHACGILGSYIAMSYEKFIADEEICGMIKRMLKPLDVTDERIDLPTIKEVGVGGEYLSHPTTLKYCRSEYFMPELMVRTNHATWQKNGKKTLDKEARILLTRRLAEYRTPEIDPKVKSDLAEYVLKRKQEQ